MDFKQLAEAHYSTRAYEPRGVEPAKLDQVLEAARLAPTAANRQAFRIVVVTDPELRSHMRDAYHREWFYTAPVIIVACGIPDRNWARADGKLGYPADSPRPKKRKTVDDLVAWNGYPG